MFWTNKLDKTDPVEDIKNLPNYAFQFFFKNIGSFKLAFIMLSLANILSTLFSFCTTLLVADILTKINDITVNRLTTYYLPVFIVLKIASEICDYFIRRYYEGFPTLYIDNVRLRFYNTILNSNFHLLFNFSKEKLNEIIDKYLENIKKFLQDWIPNTSGNFTVLIIILIILYIQNPLVLLINVIYMGIILLVSLKISSKFSSYVQAFTNSSIDAENAIKNFSLNLNTVERLMVGDLFKEVYIKKATKRQQDFKEFKKFHANRWFLQLNMINLAFILTFFGGVYQVINGTLPLGFLILIQWAFSGLWSILVYIIEYYVELINQKENAKIARDEFANILIFETQPTEDFPTKFESLKLENISTNFINSKDKEIHIDIPKFELNKAEKILVEGESGSGKSTFLTILLKMILFNGYYVINDKDARKLKFTREDICLISNNDPIFNISFLENITLGKNVHKQNLQEVLDGLNISKFIHNLDTIVGSAQTNLSAGQLQRIRLARGVIQDAKVYLFDEAFNNIDSENKKEIIDYLNKFLADKAVIFVTHTKDEIGNVEKRYRMENYELLQISS